MLVISFVMFTDWLEFPADDVTTLVLSNSESFHSLFATYTYCSQEVKNLPVNSRKCYLHDEKRLRHFGRYHNSDCDHLCTASNVEATCNCIPSYLPQVPAHRLCTLTALPCYIDVNKHMDIWVGSEQCDCLRDCESRVYSVDMMPGNLRARKYALSDI
ncbi:unnamed protein product [Diatraea saccharalis]|uniref:Uncharacterized protein n=1 Tax=Diatraea saccharalis TaxID=40085 RepID=A0A9N9R4A1_9NEOP|nr:unnamed protein product [Diatraea saccharalis]